MTDVSAAQSSGQLTTAATAASASSNLSAGASNLKIGYDTFLTLLTTQLKHQDPTSPLDTNQFTTQLVQMTGVQQQLLSNELLQTLVNQNGGGGVSQAVGLIGKTVRAAGGAATLDGGQATWSYDLGSAAASATLEVRNSAGRTVWSGQAPSLAAGRHDFTWNGKDANGAQLADGGAYTLTVAAADSAGKTVAAGVELKGVVSSVQTVNGATVLNIGKSQVPYSSVDEIAASS